MAVLFLLLLCATTSSGVSFTPRGIDPAHAKNITVYHVNPAQYGAIPLDMDTGDAAGDLFFDLFQVIISPLACANKSHTHGHACTNPEAQAPNLMVNKLTLEIDSRFSGYAKCNVCVNGTDGRGHKCQVGEKYFCYCEGHYDDEIPCNKTLGLENVHKHFSREHHHGCSGKYASKSECYTHNAVSKYTDQYPGYWYSSLSKGYCNNTDTEDCTWKVLSVDKVVTRACHIKVFGDVVKATAPDCFESCGSQSTNTSSPCWVDCFYKAAIGPDSGRPGGKVAGMSIEKLIDAWEKPFLPESSGGCPNQKVVPQMVVV